MNFISRISIAPLLPIIEGEFGLGHAQAGSLFIFLATGYCTGLFASPFISSQLNHRRTIILSATAVGGAMLALSGSASIPAMRMGLLFLGISAGFYLPSGMPLLTDLVGTEHWGKAFAIHELAPNVSLITAPLLIEALLRIMPWRGIYATLGVLSALMGGLFFLFGQGGQHKGETPNLSVMRDFLINRSFWSVSALLVLCVGGNMGVFMMLPLYLVDEVGMDRGLANTLLGISRVFPVLIVVFSGLIADRIGHRRATVVFLAVMGILTLTLGLVQGRFITPTLLFLHPLASVSAFPATLALLLGTFPPNLRGLAMSLVGLVGFFGGAGLIPQAIGYFGETFSFSLGFCLVGIVVLATLALVFHDSVRSNSPTLESP